MFIGAGGVTLLMKACKRMSVECVKVLLEYGARIYDCDEWGVYPIHVCAGAYGDFDDSLKILDILLEAGNPEDIHMKDAESEKLPLHYAAQYGNKKLCQKLLDMGVDINAKDKHGRTAYMSCERQKKVREFLEQQGCELPKPPEKKPLPPLFPAIKNTNQSSNQPDSLVAAPAALGRDTSMSLEGEVSMLTTEVEINALKDKESAGEADHQPSLTQEIES